MEKRSRHFSLACWLLAAVVAFAMSGLKPAKAASASGGGGSWQASGTVATAAPPTVRLAPQRASLLDAIALIRAVYMGLLLLAAGLAWFMVFIEVPAAFAATLRRGLALLALGGVTATALYLQATALAMTGESLLSGTLAQRAALQSTLGASLCLGAAGFAVLLAGSLTGGRNWWLAGAAVLAISRGVTGHPVSSQPSSLLIPLMVLHVSCAAFWVGSLWPLHRVLGLEKPAAAAIAVLRFSSLALVAVAALACAGAIAALIHLRTQSALLGTWYGQLLIMKSTWFSVLMGIAAYHKLRLTPGSSRATYGPSGTCAGAFAWRRW
ncbi:MAG: CopD family protein [Gammaproteobacteria bacterium]|nr:CopD family protein [Gammaproteobacteria bacterium]